MKQHITQEQWNEISKYQQEKFNVMFSENDTKYVGDSECHTCGLSGLVNIGQMIEFLLPDILHMEKMKEVGVSWVLKCRFQDEIFKRELVDALWEAIKVRLQPDFEEKNCLHV